MATDEYFMRVNLGALGFDDAVARVTAVLSSEGFGVLTEIDVQQTLDAKLGVAFRPYRILGACNPKLAHRALELEPEIGLLLPCNVVVQQQGATVEVLIADPKAMLGLAPGSKVESVANEAEERLRRVATSLEAGAAASVA